MRSFGTYPVPSDALSVLHLIRPSCWFEDERCAGITNLAPCPKLSSLTRNWACVWARLAASSAMLERSRIFSRAGQGKVCTRGLANRLVRPGEREDTLYTVRWDIQKPGARIRGTRRHEPKWERGGRFGGQVNTWSCSVARRHRFPQFFFEKKKKIKKSKKSGPSVAKNEQIQQPKAVRPI